MTAQHTHRIPADLVLAGVSPPFSRSFLAPAVRVLLAAGTRRKAAVVSSCLPLSPASTQRFRVGRMDRVTWARAALLKSSLFVSGEQAPGLPPAAEQLGNPRAGTRFGSGFGLLPIGSQQGWSRCPCGAGSESVESPPRASREAPSSYLMWRTSTSPNEE